MLNRKDLRELNKSVIRTVLESGIPLNKDCVKRLSDIESDADLITWIDTRVRVLLDPTSQFEVAYINVRGDNNWNSRSLDEDGNETMTFKVKVELSTSSWSTNDLNKFTQQHELIGKTLELAKKLDAEFSGEYKFITCTKEELEKREVERFAQEVLDEVHNVVDKLRKGMREGSEREFSKRDFFTDVPEGRYEVTFQDGNYNSKCFKVNVGSQTVFVRRST